MRDLIDIMTYLAGIDIGLLIAILIWLVRRQLK
jgi:hypothetical protein